MGTTTVNENELLRSKKVNAFQLVGEMGGITLM